MKSKVHFAAAIVATVLIAVFIVSTVIVEVFGGHETIAIVKQLIVWPGLFVLVPTIAATGITGFALSKSRHGRIVEKKKRRMPFIAANGVLILIPSALYLSRLASADLFGYLFYSVQVLELMAGVVNLILMGLNLRDGFRLRGR